MSITSSSCLQILFQHSKAELNDDDTLNDKTTVRITFGKKSTTLSHLILTSPLDYRCSRTLTHTSIHNCIYMLSIIYLPPAKFSPLTYLGRWSCLVHDKSIHKVELCLIRHVHEQTLKLFLQLLKLWWIVWEYKESKWSPAV